MEEGSGGVVDRRDAVARGAGWAIPSYPDAPRDPRPSTPFPRPRVRRTAFETNARGYPRQPSRRGGLVRIGCPSQILYLSGLYTLKEALKNAEGVLVCDAGASCRVSLRNARLFHGELLAPM